MNRFLCFLLTSIIIFTLCACSGNNERADELSIGFIRELLKRDNEGMKQYIHPDHIDSAMPGDDFYKTLEEQFLTVGHDLTALDSISKSQIDDMQFSGEALKCSYVARVNELFYTVELIILDNENGYGIVSVAMVLNTDIQYYT